MGSSAGTNAYPHTAFTYLCMYITRCRAADKTHTLSVAEKSAQWHHCVLAVSLFSLLLPEWAFKARLNIIILLHKSGLRNTSLNMLCTQRAKCTRHNTKRNNSRRVIFNEPDQIINQLALSSERRGINAARIYKTLHTLESDFIALCYVCDRPNT
jgi:hypothetical protein